MQHNPQLDCSSALGDRGQMHRISYFDNDDDNDDDNDNDGDDD
jgi:hypothetical protein